MSNETRIKERSITDFFSDSLTEVRGIHEKMLYSHIHGIESFFDKKFSQVLFDLNYDIDYATEQVEVDVARKVTDVQVDNHEIVEVKFLKVKPALKSSVLSFFGIGYGAACAFFLSPFALGGVFIGVLGVLLNLYKNRDILSKDEPETRDLLEVFIEIGRIIIANQDDKPVATFSGLESRLSSRFDAAALKAILDNLIQRKLIKKREESPEGYIYESASVDELSEYVSEVYGPEVTLEHLDRTSG